MSYSTRVPLSRAWSAQIVRPFFRWMTSAGAYTAASIGNKIMMTGARTRAHSSNRNNFRVGDNGNQKSSEILAHGRVRSLGYMCDDAEPGAKCSEHRAQPTGNEARRAEHFCRGSVPSAEKRRAGHVTDLPHPGNFFRSGCVPHHARRWHHRLH